MENPFVKSAWEVSRIPADDVDKDDTYKVGPYNVTIEFDFEDVQSRYVAWKNAVSRLSGDKIGVAREKVTLYDSLMNHGKVSRIVYGKEGPKETQAKKSGEGGSKILPDASEIFSGEMGQHSLPLLDELKQLMDSEGANDSSMNPRNMVWRSDIKGWNPKPMERNGEVLLDDNGRPRHKARKGPIFGHYRTETYVEYRREVKGMDEIDAVSSEWYNQSAGEAKPPMWQALYGTGKEDLELGDSLHMIVNDAVEAGKKGHMTILPSTPVEIIGLGAAQAVYNGLSDVKDFFDKAVRDPAFKTPSGNFSATKVQNYWKKNTVILDEKSEEKLMKKIMETITADYPMKISKVPIYLARNQIYLIAKLAGFQKPAEPETPEETAQGAGLIGPDKRPDVQKMDWRMVLAR